jgi:hypothetical protein
MRVSVILSWIVKKHVVKHINKCKFCPRRVLILFSESKCSCKMILIRPLVLSLLIASNEGAGRFPDYRLSVKLKGIIRCVSCFEHCSL